METYKGGTGRRLEYNWGAFYNLKIVQQFTIYLCRLLQDV